MTLDPCENDSLMMTKNRERSLKKRKVFVVRRCCEIEFKNTVEQANLK